MNAVVRARVDEEIKERAAEILKQSGLTVSDVIRITLNRIASDGEYSLIPNAVTAKTILDGRKGKNMHAASNVDDLFEQLGI
ncbi:MAG: type II toxin-antitoxin system RelB/DinJ family antitoxin [Deferribacteraceae bacterium]|jgi:DNA-damage-inducible protein J|nr:type II toxin-antitoxin system RelB/DinJ family antitoxin [Deferribacteraceae bacterium]